MIPPRPCGIQHELEYTHYDIHSLTYLGPERLTGGKTANFNAIDLEAKDR